MAKRSIPRGKAASDRAASILSEMSEAEPDHSPERSTDLEGEPQMRVLPAPVAEPGPEPEEPAASPESSYRGPEFVDDSDGEDVLPEPERAPSRARTRRLSGRPALQDYGRVDGRTLRRSDRLPLATRISPEAHDTVRRLADQHGYSIADLIEQGIDLIAKKLDKRKK